MSTVELALKETPSWALSLGRRAMIPALIFIGSFLAYYLATTEFLEREPPQWYQHHLYLTEAILNGTLDVGSVGIPDFYQDTIVEGTEKYVPFPPGPAVLLMPFVAIWGTDFSQIYFSMAVGAVNVVLFWYLLGLLNVSRTTKLLLIPFFAFGTVHLFTATTGTAWHYAHTTAVFFLLLAVIFLLRRVSPVVPAFFLGFAFLSREPTILAAPFFAYWLLRQRHESLFEPIRNGQVWRDRQTLLQMGLFGGGLVPFIAFWFWYNIVRFGGPLETGYDVLYEQYVAGNIYSFYRGQFPSAPHFNQFDVRNVPLHLYSLFLIPPQFHPDWSVFRPSPYGLSVLLTSPAFIYAFFVKRKDILKPACWMAIAAISVPLFLHYSQGWVQFGYRFLLDFAPFLLILTALGFDDHASPAGRRLQFCLVAIAVLAGFWGRYWANQLGW